LNKIKASVYLKRRFRKAKLNNDSLSFKEFVRKLVKNGDELAIEWFLHKSHSFNELAKQLRLKNKGAKIAAEKNATKMSRKRTSSKGKSSSIGWGNSQTS
jgi:hypothetical protein